MIINDILLRALAGSNIAIKSDADSGDSMDDIQNLLKKIKQLQPLSRVVHKVPALADDPECGLKDLIHLVEHDPAITANLLRTCNSVFLGLPVKVDSVQQAVSMLGLQQVAQLVLAQNLSTHMTRAQKGYQKECIGIDRLSYHVHEGIFDDFFLGTDELKDLMLIYEGFIKGAQRLFEANA